MVSLLKEFKPTSVVIIDSTKINKDVLNELESILYGTESAQARLPLPYEIYAMISRSPLHDVLVSIMETTENWLWDQFNFITDTVFTAIKKLAEDSVHFEVDMDDLMLYPDAVFYPCIVYNRLSSSMDNEKTEYLVEVIDSDPDKPIFNKIEALPYATFDEEYEQDGLYYSVFKIIY